MTYEEIKKRLTEVESTLQIISSNKTRLESPYTKKTLKNLSTLKESLEKKLSNLSEQKPIPGFGIGKDEEELEKLKKGFANAKVASDIPADATAQDIASYYAANPPKVNEEEGVEFDQNETAMIAMETGKALAKALINTGDELARMRVKRIQPMSFDVHVVYKGERNMDDEFAFHIEDNNLHLADFSFDKKLVEVGVAGSGKPIINKDVLTNELMKHFKSLNEVVNEINYSTYTEPNHFDICPGAESLRDELIKGGKSPEELGEWTFKHDELFKLEKAVLKANKADERHVKVANRLKDEIISLSRDLEIEPNKINYLKGHVQKIEDIANKTDGKGDNVTLMSTDIYEASASGLTPLQKFVFNYELDISDRDFAFKELPDIKKLKTPEDVYHYYADDRGWEGTDMENDLDNIYKQVKRQFGVKETKGAPKGHYFTKSGNLVKGRLTKDARERGARLSDPKDKQRSKVPPVTQYKSEDIDVGHQDNEPSMIKKQLYRIIKDAKSLYDALGKYEGSAEVDFPSWWQSKITKSQSYLSGAHDYLDSEENVKDSEIAHGPLNFAISEVVKEGTDLYDRNGIHIKRFAGGPRGLMVQITYGREYIQIPADEFPILARAMQSVIGDLRDMNLQVPRDKNMDEEIEDKELPKGKHSVSQLQKVHGLIVDKMKELNDLRKEKGGDHMYQGGTEPGKHSVMDHLKSLTKKKKQVEDALDKAVSNVGRGQELNEFVGGELEKRNDALYSKLVPASGNSDFIEGEILRAINRIIYRYYNDGDFFYQGYGAETAGPAHAFLTNSREIPFKLSNTLTQIFNKAIGAPEDGYARLLNFALETILDYIESKEGNYTKSNEDMFNYESEFEDDSYDEEEDDYYEEDEDYYNEGKYKSDAQRKAIYATKAEKNEAELTKAEKKKLKDMSKSLKKSSKGHAGQAKYIDKLVK